jgi:hypothetical protein
MIASGAVPALLPAHIGVSKTSQFTNQSGLCRHPAFILAFINGPFGRLITQTPSRLLSAWQPFRRPSA